MKYRKTVSLLALSMSCALTRSIRAQSTVYSSVSGPTTTVYNFTSGEIDGGYDGIGDDYSSNYTSINVTGMSFFGGLTRGDDYLQIEFFYPDGAPAGVYANATPASEPIRPFPSETQGIGLHTLSAADFIDDGSPITIPGSGYVVFSPISYASDNVVTGVYTAADPLPPVFSLGFGQAPTVGSNNASTSVMTNDYSNRVVMGQVSSGAYASTANQYAQFSITGIGSGIINGNGSNGASGVWSAATSGSWEVSGNWQGGIIPTGATQTAGFADSIGSGSATVTLTANETVGNVVFSGSSGGAYNIGSTGIPTLTLDNGGVPAIISVNAGSQTISAPISLVSGLTVSTTSGSLTLAGTVTGTGPVTVNASSSLVVSPSGALALSLIDNGQVTFARQTTGSTILARTVPSLTLNAGATLSLAAAPAGVGRQVLVVTGNGDNELDLSLSGGSGNWTSKLDLANNDAIISEGYQYLGTITNQIMQGYNGGNWQGSGGIVSSSAAADTTHLTALGVIQNDDGTGHPLYSTFDGVAVGDYDVLIKYTYYGDANLDGKVDGSDYTRIDYAYDNNQNSSNPQLTGWFNGDFNYDGVIDGSDYTLIDNAFNSQVAQISALVASSTNSIASPVLGGTTAAVPEPASVLITAGVLLTRVGRRRRSSRATAGPDACRI